MAGDLDRAVVGQHRAVGFGVAPDAVPPIQSATADELPARTLHDILQLRAAVFVVEQRCAYLDVDGRDVEPGARHWWIEDDGAVVACLRQLDEPDDVTRLGRIVTDAAHRGEGLAGALITAAMAATQGPVVMGVQAHLARWYRRFGFSIAGDLYIEDGIDHLPMRLDRPGPPSPPPDGSGRQDLGTVD